MKIEMPLYETDNVVLLSFVNEGSGSELVLYNFAADLMYSEKIQPDLINATLPLYSSILESAIFGESSDHVQIIGKFNDSLFFNKERIIEALSTARFSDLMRLYERCVIDKVNKSELLKMNWISWCNTFFALDDNNIVSFFKVFDSHVNLQGQSSYFLYLTSLLFKKKDNLLLEEIQDVYDSPALWEFQSDQVDGLCWNSTVRQSFKSIITIDFVRELFSKITPLLIKTFEVESISFIKNEIYSKEISETFETRKNEFLQKIESGGSNHYWSDAFY